MRTLILIAFIVGIALLWVLRDQGDNPPRNDRKPSSSQPTKTKVPLAKVPLPTNPKIMIDRVEPGKTEPAQPGKPMILYPDGSSLPVLNGVTEYFGHISWPAKRAYSPVIGRFNDGTKDWYVHQDGCHSTVFYPDEVIRNGKVVHEPVGKVSAPAQAVPQKNFIRADGKTDKDKQKLPVER